MIILIIRKLAADQNKSPQREYETTADLSVW